MNTNHLAELINYLAFKRFCHFIFIKIAFAVLFLPGCIHAQKPYYFHTIHSHGLSATGGRTAKINYMYQMNHTRQLKLSGSYIYDSYDQGRNHIKTNIYNTNIQLQYNIIHKNTVFLNVAVGAGGYYLSAKDLLNIKHREWRFNFVTGMQAEIYILRNTLALTVDYDIFFMPWSRIYDFMHIPTAGVTLFLF